MKCINLLKIIVSILLCCLSLVLLAQPSPGGVPGNLTLWLKANTTTAANLVLAGGNVSEWHSETGVHNVTQPTAARQPLFQPLPAANADFNFNPNIKFNSANTHFLRNTATNPNLLGSGGTYFIVVNTFPGVDVNPSAFTYATGSNYRYQGKPGFRMQTGVPSGTGHTSDYVGGPAVVWPNIAATILTSRNTGSSFRARRNGYEFNLSNSSSTFYPQVNNGLYIGANGGNSERFNGSVAEVICFNTTLTAADQNKVESYLAVKYGITLNQTGANPVSYVASNGTVIWDAPVNSGYANNITGIGRDDGAGLLQKQSKSVNTRGIVFLYNENTGGVFPPMNTDNTTTFAADNSFLLFGDNNGDTSLSACIHNGHLKRMDRIWKVQKTGTVGMTTLAVNNIHVPAAANHLLVSSDPTFPPGATDVYALTNTGTQKYVSCVLNNGQYFTFSGDSISYTVTGNTPLCAGETLLLDVNASAGSTYEWTGPNGFFSTAANPSIPGVTPAHSGMYSVRVTQNGCTGPEVSVTVTVYDQPVADFTTEIRKGCGPDTVYFTSTGTPATDYVWDLGDGNSSTDSALIYVYQEPGTYTVTLYTSSGHCTDAIAEAVTVEGYIPLDVIITDVQPIRCHGGYEGGFSVHAGGGVPPYRYGLNGRLPVSNGNFAGLTAGRYVVSVTDDKGCMGTDTVILSDPPLLSLFVTEVKDDLCEESRTPNGSAGLWIDGGTPPYRLLLNGESQDEHTSLKGLSEGVHTVIVQDVNGCSRAGSFSISHVTCCTLHLPSAFTPNGDGRNDHARPVTTGGVVLVEFRIYNRWGEPVYEATPGGGGISGWDGLYKGRPAEVGTYHYTLQYACPGDNRNRHEKGDITLIR